MLCSIFLSLFYVIPSVTYSIFLQQDFYAKSMGFYLFKSWWPQSLQQDLPKPQFFARLYMIIPGCSCCAYHWHLDFLLHSMWKGTLLPFCFFKKDIHVLIHSLEKLLPWIGLEWKVILFTFGSMYVILLPSSLFLIFIFFNFFFSLYQAIGTSQRKTRYPSLCCWYIILLHFHYYPLAWTWLS